MNKKNITILVISIFILCVIFIKYDGYKKEKLKIEKENLRVETEKKELLRIIELEKSYVLDNKGTFEKFENIDEKEVYKVSIEDEYILNLNSELFKKEETKNENIQIISFYNEENELKVEFEILYYTPLKMTFLIDDVGMTTSIIKYFEEVGRPLNFAILPFLAHSKESNEILTSKGYTTLLHMPMEGSNKSLNDKTEGIIYPSMSDKKIIENFKKSIANVGNVAGFNNHMGSVFTSNEEKMKTVLNYAKSNNLFYVDSKTTSKNKGYQLSKDMGIKTAVCKHFLDNSKEVEDIKKEIRRAVEITKSNKKALFIGHFQKNTAIALKESIEYIESEGIKIVSLNEILE